ncbi:MAG: hypothetical protein D6784_04960 [Chloroflexi bacterium]|nr:MAG: hypothetical protein D6784_04960 [Chloroflexota bacterium]
MVRRRKTACGPFVGQGEIIRQETTIKSRPISTFGRKGLFQKCINLGASSVNYAIRPYNPAVLPKSLPLAEKLFWRHTCFSQLFHRTPNPAAGVFHGQFQPGKAFNYCFVVGFVAVKKVAYNDPVR